MRQKDRIRLEALIDSTSLPKVVETLSTICYAESERTGDDGEVWENAGARLGELADEFAEDFGA